MDRAPTCRWLWLATDTRTSPSLLKSGPHASAIKLSGVGFTNPRNQTPAKNANARLATFSTSSTVLGDDRGLTSGTINTDVGSFPYTLYWTVQEQAVLVAEALTYPLYPDGRINAMYWWTAGRRTHARPKPTATGLDLER